MTEPDFLAECDRLLRVIEDALDVAEIDVDSERSGNVLTLEFDNGSKIIVNGNAPMREMWIAAKSGGFHFSKPAALWLDTRSAEEFFSALSKLVSQQAQAIVVLRDR